MTTEQQTERDEALIAEVARVISRKVDSFGDTERIEQQRAQLEWPRYREHAKAAIDIIRERLRGDEPAKPDRYLEIWQEAFKAWDGLYCANDRAAAAVLRRHFEPSAEVKAMLETFSADVVDAQSRYVIVHQLRASADIQDRETKRKTGWADTNDRACLMRSAADAIEALADFILKGDQ